MSSPNNVPVFDFEVLKGSTQGLEITLINITIVDDEEVEAPRNLTGKELRVIFEGVFSDSQVILSSDDSENDYGSVCEITDAVAGIFQFSLNGTESATAINKFGRWRVVEVTDDEPIILIRGALSMENP